MFGRSRSAALLGGMALLVAATAVAAKVPVPEGRTYFTIFEGLGDSNYEVSADCLQFSAKQACLDDGTLCFEWNRSEEGVQTRKQTTFEFADEYLDDGLLIELDGRGLADDRGPRSSLAAVGRLRSEELDAKINIALSGRATSPGRCRRLVEEFEASLGTE